MTALFLVIPAKAGIQGTRKALDPRDEPEDDDGRAHPGWTPPVSLDEGLRRASVWQRLGTEAKLCQHWPKSTGGFDEEHH